MVETEETTKDYLEHHWYLSTHTFYPSTIKESNEVLKKFGLTNSVIPDSWTASYSPDYAIAIWYGYVDGLDATAVKNKHYITMNHATNERTKIQAEIGNKIYENK